MHEIVSIPETISIPKDFDWKRSGLCERFDDRDCIVVRFVISDNEFGRQKSLCGKAIKLPPDILSTIIGRHSDGNRIHGCANKGPKLDRTFTPTFCIRTHGNEKWNA